MENIEKLRKENIQLRQTLALCLNKPLIKELAEALERIRFGEYVSEEEFFRDSPLNSF